MSSDPYRIIKLHIVTERSTVLKESLSEYVFKVDKRANKHAIRDAVEQIFKVKVDRVHTMIMPGKMKRMGRYEGKTPTWKKAIVRLKDKQVISMFDNM
ncbi:MAG: 50S ribosomal protein L23 [candidate division Zixibacteria bacterium]|nr:50S ribosomal protein L23 [candidate division Zixibacteria bacterium]